MDIDSDYGSDTHEVDNGPVASTSNGSGTGAQGRKRKGRKGANAQDGGYAWEGEFQRTWDVVQEDATGSLESVVSDLVRKRRRIQVGAQADGEAIQRGIIRHVFLLLDLSTSMLDRDLRPSRLELMLNHAQDFVSEFFDANPISQLGIIGLRDGLAVRVTPLSGNPAEHIKALQNKRKLEPSGEPSLQNGLEMARAGLGHLPSHGSREILGVFGSLTTCDPGNIHQTLDRCVKQGLRISIIGLSAEMAICKLMASRTDGALSEPMRARWSCSTEIHSWPSSYPGFYGVATSELHFRDLILDAVQPPATTTAAASLLNEANHQASLIQMGFPTMTLTSTTGPTFCACHATLKSSGFLCPRCKSQLCAIPSDCPICGLTVVSSLHLARSYRHLFPLKTYKEVSPAAESPSASSSGGARCRGCQEVLQRDRFQCPKCRHVFCSDCEAFVHDGLAVCPGC